MSYKRFDLKKARAGDKLITRDGGEVLEFTYFESLEDEYTNYPKCIAVVRVDGDLFLRSYHSDGSCVGYAFPSSFDLFMAPKKTTYWLSVEENDEDLFRRCSYLYRSEESLPNRLSSSDFRIISVEIED